MKKTEIFMHNLLPFSLALIFLLLTGTATAATQCTQGGLTRTISVVYSNPGEQVPCEVFYEKSSTGQSMTLWRAQNELGYCEARASDFINKLTDLGWQCNAADADRPNELDSDTQSNED